MERAAACAGAHTSTSTSASSRLAPLSPLTSAARRRRERSARERQVNVGWRLPVLQACNLSPPGSRGDTHPPTRRRWPRGRRHTHTPFGYSPTADTCLETERNAGRLAKRWQLFAVLVSVIGLLTDRADTHTHAARARSTPTVCGCVGVCQGVWVGVCCLGGGCADLCVCAVS